MPGDQQEPHELDGVVSGHGALAVRLADDSGDEVELGIAGPLDSLLHDTPAVLVERDGTAPYRLRVVAATLLGVEQIFGDPLQVHPLQVGQAEPRAQRARGQRVGQLAGQVGAACRDDRLEHLADKRRMRPSSGPTRSLAK